MSNPRYAMTDDRASRPAVRRLTGGVALALAVTLLAAGGTTLALFSSQAATSLRAIVAGDLDLTMGQLTWEQVTASVPPDKRASGMGSATPDGFWSMPGDVFTIQVPVKTVLQGDNLEADLEIAVDYDPGDDQPIIATYHVDDESGGTVTGETPIGDTAVIPGLLGSSAPGVTARIETGWTVVLTVTVQPDYQWVNPYQPETAPEPTRWSVGTVTADLKQVRPWEGGRR